MDTAYALDWTRCWLIDTGNMTDAGNWGKEEEARAHKPAKAWTACRSQVRQTVSWLVLVTARYHFFWRCHHLVLFPLADIGSLELRFSARFLRKKYSSFAKDDSEPHHRPKKKKAKQIPSTLGINEGPSTSKNTNVDLNHDSAMVCFQMPCSQTVAVIWISYIWQFGASLPAGLRFLTIMGSSLPAECGGSWLPGVPGSSRTWEAWSGWCGGKYDDLQCQSISL